MPLADEDPFVSGTFWLTLALIVLTLVLIALGFWAVIIARARRALQWKVSVVPMLRTDRRLADTLTVSWEGVELRTPVLATVTLVNTGRLDIGSSAFDGGRPIRIAFGAPMAGLIEPEADQKDGLMQVRRVGDDVHVGPGLFKKRATLVVSALVDGAGEVVVDTPLENVRVTEAASEATPPVADRMASWAAAWAGTTLVVGVVVGVIQYLYSKHH